MGSAKRLRLGVMVSGGGTTMQNLAEVIARQELDAEIVVCIASNAKCFGCARAKRLGVPLEVITRKECGTVAQFSGRIIETLEKYGAELAVMAGYLSLWEIPKSWAGRVMNIHPALLPKFGGKGMHGAHVHAAVLAAGETESGCTVHFADNQYDHGTIIVQRKVPVVAGDTAESLAKRVFVEECVAYPEAIRRYMRGEAKLR
jgi:formyltetrahydrofolate-dependent phosphoribosylglycinamide formyltransferase